ncbi:MAG: glycine--tRNA ligase subunit beta [Limnochordia bacterium]|jgi:glycyl-tRNA synthetase beta chain
MKQDLLFEIGLEELPARMVDSGMANLKAKGEELLAEYRLDHGEIMVWGTPRRLTLYVRDVACRQADLVEEAKGPAKKIAFDEEGRPTKAAIGFAKGHGIPLEDLEVRSLPQGEYVFAQIKKAGLPAIDVLPQFCTRLIDSLSFPKNMRWGSYDYRFARPIRWLVGLFGDQLIPFSVAGVDSGRTTRGHRFIHPQPVELTRPDEYLEVLERAGVLVDPQLRRERIKQQIEEAAQEAGGQVLLDEDLLAEVTNLVEYPRAIWGEFDASYLSLPREVLITPMREHQRYFPVLDGQGRLLNRFITVANGQGDRQKVRQGNEKVLAARLADAQFFWETDQRLPLADYVERLDQIVFQEELGTVYDKVQRVQSLVDKLAAELKVGQETKGIAIRGAYLAKADLVTNMVGEFPELQGVMGREYALRSGESPEVAQVVYEHYLPRWSGDRLPESTPGAIVSIADKLDTIVGCFAIGLLPTGSQDPYALRRQALGIINIMLEQSLDVSLPSLIKLAAAGYDRTIEASSVEEVHRFFMGRLRGILSERGVRYDVIDSVIAVEQEHLPQIIARTEAIQQVLSAPEFEVLLTACQRVGNLASKAEDEQLDPQLFQEPEEVTLYESYLDIRSKVEKAVSGQDYRGALQVLAQLKEPINAFFDAVLVMSDDPAIRKNRLALLKALTNLFQRICDFSLIVGT